MAVSTPQAESGRIPGAPLVVVQDRRVGVDPSRASSTGTAASAAGWWSTATTPPPKHKALTGQDDPHLFREDRLGARWRQRAVRHRDGAQIEDGRYRIFRAGTARD